MGDFCAHCDGVPALCQHREEMSDSGERRTAAAAALQHRDFRFYSAARLVGILGAEAQAVGVAWQVYQMTHSALALGYTGLALFLPGLFFTLPAGHVADLFDRRTVLLACYVLQFGATLWLLDMTMHGVTNVAWIYGALALIGLGRCFSGPAAAALVPMLVPKEHFVNAVTWGSAIFQIATASGPMFGGILFTVSLAGTRWARWTGAPVVYIFTLGCIVLYLVMIAMIRPRGAAEKKGFTLKTMLAGLQYVAHTRLLLGSISLDLFAVLLGGATSLLPIFADDGAACGAAWAGVAARDAEPGSAVGFDDAAAVSDEAQCGEEDAGVRGDLWRGDGGVWAEPEYLAELRGAAGGGRVGHDFCGGAVEHFAAGDAERDAWAGVERELAVSGREQ